MGRDSGRSLEAKRARVQNGEVWAMKRPCPVCNLPALDSYVFCTKCKEYRIETPEGWLVHSLATTADENGHVHAWTISRHKSSALAERAAKRARHAYPALRIVVTHDPVFKSWEK